MARYEMTVSPEYVKDWGVTEAIRELFQNALDRQTTNPESEMTWEYHPEDTCFVIKNKKSSLTKDTLLFGISTKTKQGETIGKWGEGYKLALLVLARMGYEVFIYNHQHNETWVPKIIKSRRYGSSLLIIDVEKAGKLFGKKPRKLELKIVVKGITQDDMVHIRKSNLHIKPPEKVIEAVQGQILSEKKYKSQIFVNGLFVCKKDNFNFGYNIKTEYMDLDRDRRLIQDFDLSWLTSQMWRDCSHPGPVNNMLKKKAPDTLYLSSWHMGNENPIIRTIYADFVGNHGKKAVPVSSQEEYDTVKKHYKKLRPVIVKEQVKTILVSSCNEIKDLKNYAEKRPDPRTPTEIIEELYNEANIYLNQDLQRKFQLVVETSKQWTFK